MTTLLHSGNFGVYGITKRRFDEWNDDFSLLGEDEYVEVDGKPTKELIDAIVADTPVISWCASHFSFQTMYVYSDIVSSQVVGNVRANLLRVVVPKGQPSDIVKENFVNPYYSDVRMRSFNTIEVLLRDDNGQPIPFKGGVVEITLHFNFFFSLGMFILATISIFLLAVTNCR